MQTEPIEFKVPEAPIHYSSDEALAWQSGYEEAVEKSKDMAIALQNILSTDLWQKYMGGGKFDLEAKEALKQAGL
jgi:hypothetical protein